MTLSSDTSRSPDYPGANSTATFATTFQFDDEDDLTVSVTSSASVVTTLTKTTDYTVIGEHDDDGGNVTLVDANQAWVDGSGNLLTGYTLAIQREVDVTQPDDFKNQGAFSALNYERSADRMVMIDQQQQRTLDGCIRIPSTEDPDDYSMTLPAAATRASKYLAFDSSGNISASSVLTTGNLSVSSYMETLLDDSSNTTARQTLLLDKAGADVASDATINLTTSTGDLIDVTGTTTITAITLAEGVEKTVRFTGALTLTHGASLILPTSANIITEAGDYAVFRGYASSVVRCVSYHRLHGGPVASMAQDFQARLTLTSATPVVAADQTAKTTVYLTPYLGNRIALYDGAEWTLKKLTEISIAVPATTSQMYDIFVYNNAGTLTLEAVAWTNDTTRATALTRQDGVYVKTGTLTKRYVGSFRTTGASGETEDSFAKRFVWNYYNRVLRPMRVLEATNTWTYTTAAFQQANAAATNQLDFIIGLDEQPVSATVVANAANDNAGVALTVAIGLDSATVASTSGIRSTVFTPVAAYKVQLCAHYKGFPGIGRHYLSWLEYSVATGTTTWAGDNGALLLQSGIHGEYLG